VVRNKVFKLLEVLKSEPFFDELFQKFVKFVGLAEKWREIFGSCQQMRDF
jgi:hypothetical protein